MKCGYTENDFSCFVLDLVLYCVSLKQKQIYFYSNKLPLFRT